MAEIKLDISEYNLLIDKGKLLEEALSREKQWAERVDTLNQEKIEAYQKAEKQIVIRKITEKREYRAPSHISMEQLGKVFNSIRNTHYSSANLDPNYVLSTIENVLKDKNDYTTVLDETQTFQGLNEFIEEAENKALVKLSTKAKQALEKEPIYDEAILENKKFEKLNFKLFEQNQKLTAELEISKEFGRTRLILIQEIADYVHHIKIHLQDTTLFNYKSRLKSLIVYLEKFNEKFQL